MLKITREGNDFFFALRPEKLLRRYICEQQRSEGKNVEALEANLVMRTF